MSENTVSRQETRIAGPLRVALIMSIIGLINALAAAQITYYLNSHQPVAHDALKYWSSSVIASLMWPSGIMMMAADSGGPFSRAVILAISLIANGMVYGLAGLVMALGWYKLLRRHLLSQPGGPSA